jgi:hypothetical protein
MHLYFYARGKFSQVEEWKALAQGAFWKWRRIEKETGKETTILIQGALRPSVLGAYEYIFPKEALAEVLSFFGITKNELYGFKGLSLYGRHYVLRTIFGCKRISKKILEEAKKIPPTFTTEEFERGGSNCVVPGVAIHVIGIKKDEIREIGNYIQEAL